MGANPVKIHTDHRNLLFVFVPVALRSNAPTEVLTTVHRWAIQVSRFQFVIEHIEGVKNVFTDLLTGWSQNYRAREAACGNKALLSQSSVLGSSNLKEITCQEIKDGQEGQKPAKDAVLKAEGLWEQSNRISSPQQVD